MTKKRSSSKKEGIRGQPIFIDYIIKIMIARAYVNLVDRKLLTAEKILGNVDELLNIAIKGEKLKIITDEYMRGGAAPYTINELRAKYYLQ